MNISQDIFRAYDIRGVYGEELDSSIGERVGLAFGNFLRKTSFDELPQLFSIISGQMSFVGPRPALFNQNDLVELRTNKGIDQLLPGITGWAQVNGRDELSISEKVELEVEYMEQKSFWFDLKILWLTLVRVLNFKGVSH